MDNQASKAKAAAGISGAEMVLRERQNAVPEPTEESTPAADSPNQPTGAELVARSRLEAEQLQVQASDRQAVGANPEKEADIARLAAVTGQPPEFVRDNYDTIKPRVERGAIRADAPAVTRDAMIDPSYKAADDDFANMSMLERTIANTKHGWQKGHTITYLGKAGWEDMWNPSPDYETEVAGWRQDLQRTGAELPYIQSIPGWMAESAPFMWHTMTGALDEAAVGAAAFGTAGVAVGGAGALPGAITGAGVGFKVGMGMEAGKLEAGLAYDEFKQMRDETGALIDRDVAVGAAALVGAVNGALEATGLQYILRVTGKAGEALLSKLTKESITQLMRIPSTREALKRMAQAIGTAGLIEGVTEGLQELSNIIGREGIQAFDGGTFAPDDAGEDASRIWEAMVQGSGGGIGFALPGATVSAGVDISNARAAQQNKAFFEYLQAGLQDSKLLKRLPKKFQEFAENSVESHGAQDTVYVEPEAANKFFQEAGITPELLLKDMPLTAKALQESQLSGEAVAIPMSEFLTYIAPSEAFTALINDIKMQPDAFTANEREAMVAEQEAVMAELESLDVQAAMEDAAGGEVFQSINSQLLDLGYSVEDAAAQATLHQTFMSRLAERSGLTMDQLMARHPLTVGREARAGAPKGEVPTRSDYLLNRLRRGDVPSQQDALGKSLVQRIIEKGGLKDDEGFLESRDLLGALSEYGNRRISQPETGMTTEEAYELAFQEGYLEEGQVGQQALQDALSRELEQGEPVFAPGQENVDQQAIQAELGELERMIDEAQIDNLDELSNKEVFTIIGQHVLYQQDMGKRKTFGDLANLKTADPVAYKTVQGFIRRQPEAERKRIRKNIKDHAGTAWALSAVKGMVLRQGMHLYATNKDTKKGDEALTSTIWGDGNLLSNGVIDAFRRGEQERYITAYKFVGGNRKAEQDYSGSFVNCDPSKACAQVCYAAIGTAQTNAMIKSEFTEWAAENHPEALAKAIAFQYEHSMPAHGGLALRTNEKGDLSEAQLKVIELLNGKTIRGNNVRIQVFSKRPELLARVDDFNLKMLSVDDSNLEIADQNPDLQLSVMLNDGISNEWIAEHHDRVAVYLPLKVGKGAWSTEELKSAFPDIYAKMRTKMCPVDDGKLKMPDKATPYPNLGKGEWTCTSCDLYGSAGCFHGGNQTEKARALDNARNTPADNDAALNDFLVALKALKEQGAVDAAGYAEILNTINGGQSGHAWQPIGQSTPSTSQGPTAGNVADAGTWPDDFPDADTEVIKQLFQAALGMSEAERIGRAEALGFDTSTVYYHGTQGSYDSIRPSEFGSYGRGVYLTPNKEDANFWAMPGFYEGDGLVDPGANVRPYYIRRGTYATDKDWADLFEKRPDLSDEDRSDLLKTMGYTGIKSDSYEITVFDPANVVSQYSSFDDRGFTLEQSAWHGSPYNFDRFTLEHIGRGEGAQAYGWGLYFAGRKAVAEWYRRQLVERTSGTGEIVTALPVDKITEAVEKTTISGSPGSWGEAAAAAITQIAEEYADTLDPLAAHEVEHQAAVVASELKSDFWEGRFSTLYDVVSSQPQGTWEDIPSYVSTISALKRLLDSAANPISVRRATGVLAREFSDAPEAALELVADGIDPSDDFTTTGSEAVDDAIDRQNETLNDLQYTLEETEPDSFIKSVAEEEFKEGKIQLKWLHENYETLSEVVDDLLREYYALAKRTGQLFEVDIPDPDVLLYYDTPMQDQSAEVSDALGLAGFEFTGTVRSPREKLGGDPVEGEWNAQVSDMYGVYPEDAGAYSGVLNYPDGYHILVLEDGQYHVMIFNEDEIFTDLADAEQYLADRAEIISEPSTAEMTGMEFYSRLEDAAQGSIHTEAAEWIPDSFWTFMDTVGNEGMRPDETVSRYLNSIGVPGLRYRDGVTRHKGKDEFTYNYVIWSEGAIDVVNKLYQSYGVKPRGYIEFDDLRSYFSITMTGRADMSTFLHESGHYFVEMMGLAAKSPEADPQLGADLQAMLDYVGGTAVEDLTVEQHERLARSFEAYLYEGKAPSSELASAFSRFRQWLVGIYRSLKALNVQLSDEVRGVFDRMLAGEEAIAEAEAAVVPAFDEGTLDPDAAKSLTEKYEAAMQEALDEIYHKAARAALREQERTYNQRKRELTEEIRAEVYDEPVYAAQRFMRGRHPEDFNLAEVYDGKKMNSGDVADLFGDTAILRQVPGLIRKDRATTLHPDAFAEVFGFDSGYEMIQEIVASPSATSKIANRVQAALDAEFPDAFKDKGEALQETAQDSLNNKKMASFLMAELKAIGKKTGQPVATSFEQTAKQVALNKINNTPVMRLQPNKNLQASKRQSREAQAAVAAGDFDLAMKLKQQQILNTYLYEYGVKARDKAQKNRNALKKYTELKTRQRIGKVNPLYREAIDGYLEATAFSTESLRSIEVRQAQLDALIQHEISQGVEVATPTGYAQLGMLQNWKEMTPSELQALRDAVDNIAWLSRQEGKIQVENNRVAMDELLDQMEAIAKASATSEVKRPEHGATAWSKVKDFTEAVVASLTKVEFIVKWLDGGEVGIFHKTLFQPFVDAQHKKNDQMEALLKEIKAAFDSVKDLGNRVNVDFMDGAVAKAQLYAVALNLGNEGNRAKLLGGYGWDYNTVINGLQEHLTKDDWAAIQKIWDTIDTLWPELASTYQDQSGVPPHKVESVPVILKDGTIIKGGYYPVVYDPKKDVAGEKQEVSSLFDGRSLSATVNTGSTQKRTDYQGPLLLDLNVITTHLTDTVHYVTHYQAVKTANQLFKNQRFKKLITDTLGYNHYKNMKSWLEAIAQDSATTQEAAVISAISRWARSGLSLTAMSLNLGTALVQQLGMMTTMSEIGFPNTVNGLRLALLPGNWKFVTENSGEIRHLSKVMDRELADTIKTVVKPKGIGRKAWEGIKNNSFIFVTLSQGLVNRATFMGAYNKGSKEGMTHEEAVNYAESIIRTTQSGAGIKDLAAVQRGGEGAKLFTAFYTFFSVLYNQQREAFRNLTGKNGARSYTQLTADMMYLMILPVIADAMMRGREPDIDDEDFERFWLAQFIGYTVQSVPGVRDISQAVMYAIGVTDYPSRMAPALQMYERAVAGFGDAYKAVYEDEDMEWYQIKRIFDTGSFLLNFPSFKQGIKTAEWLEALEDGELEDPVREFIFGVKPDKR